MEDKKGVFEGKEKTEKGITLTNAIIFVFLIMFGVFAFTDRYGKCNTIKISSKQINSVLYVESSNTDGDYYRVSYNTGSHYCYLDHNGGGGRY